MVKQRWHLVSNYTRAINTQKTYKKLAMLLVSACLMSDVGAVEDGYGSQAPIFFTSFLSQLKKWW